MVNRPFEFPALPLTLASMLMLASICHADHLPVDLLARGKPEKQLAGINLASDKIADIIKRHGKPSKIEKQPSPDDLDMCDYYWIKAKAKLHVLVVRSAGLEYISLIEIEGSVNKKGIGRTGRGLKIGDRLSDLRRIYGSRYKIRDIPDRNIHDVMIEWRAEEFSLVAELDKKGSIKKLSLSPPE
jgi:hypothetical protein